MEGNETALAGRWVEGDEEGDDGRNATSSDSTVSAILNPHAAAIARRQRECENVHANLPTPDPSIGAYCPWTFDGWSCWNDTPAGTRVYVNCPDFIPGFEPHRVAHKDCDLNGTWFVHPESNLTWSNYTTCLNTNMYKMHQDVNSVYIAGYSLSLVALCVSLFIFCFFKSLKCTRVTIHKNLFVSFIINNTMWILWHYWVLESPQRIAQNTVPCQVLHVFLHYFLVANYFWMFCEGTYLHTLLVVAFVAEERIMKWFYLLGWGVPVIPIVFYSAFRGSDTNHNIHCWMEDGPYNYILSVPVVLSIFVNLLFLINIVRVLVTKLRAVNTAPDTHSTRKAVRATLILIPLLGLHYIIIPFRPAEGSPAESAYLVISALATSFQGLAVSLLFCFFNGEVLGLFKKKWNQHKQMRGGGTTSINNTTFSYMKTSMADGNTTVTNYGTSMDGDDV